MDIFYINPSITRKHPEAREKNVFIIEDRGHIGIDNVASFKSFLITLFGGRWIFENLVGVKKEEKRVIIHIRGSAADIGGILGILSCKFVLNQRSISCYSPGYFWNAPYYRKRTGRQHTMYKEALGKILTRVSLAV